MLALSRNVGETIMIGDNIALKIIKVTGGQIKIGIDAPANVHILREELVDGFVPKQLPPDLLIQENTFTNSIEPNTSSSFIDDVKKMPSILFKKKRHVG